MKTSNSDFSFVPLLIVTVVILILLSQFGVPKFSQSLKEKLIQASNPK